jgi:predicted RND superfamily exporter protein
MKYIGRKVSGALLALWLCGCAVASAQEAGTTTTPPQTAARVNCSEIVNKEDNLNEVAEKRDTLTSESSKLEQKIVQLNGQIASAPTAAQLEARRKERTELLAKSKPSDADKARIAELDDTDVKSREELRNDVKAAEAELDSKKAQARCVQQAINNIYSPEQTFKKWMSITFAGLIGLVIFGFFVVSYVDESVRRAIFSGQTGMQFLTLFSIVIAIILFGITSILGDKELSALLGGLSGYILGRHSAPGRSSPAGAGETEEAAPQGDPAQAPA